MLRGFALALVVGLALAGSDAHSAVALKSNGRITFFTAIGIASMNPDGSGQWGVGVEVGDEYPAWSPDGTQLAVVIHFAGRLGIEVMQPDGSGGRMVTTDGADWGPSWSPDGGNLAFVNGGNLYLVNADGGNRRQLTHFTDESAGRPSWSPDGMKLVYSAHRQPAGTHLYVYDVGTGSQTPLTTGGAYDDTPAWSPDGKKILFSEARNGNSAIFEVNTDGTGIKQLSDGTGDDTFPAWAPDQSHIAFARNGQIWTMARDGTNERALTSGNDGGEPAWQPLAPAPAGCTLWGTSGNDLLAGTEANDAICGLGGDDALIGLGGNDQLYGADGDDHIAGGLGTDVLVGGDGNDTLDARGGSADYVDGGGGFDNAIIDRVDRMTNIERHEVDTDLAAWRPVTADAFEPTNPPVRAVDGNPLDWWNSGGYPPHWFEVDLQVPVSIGRVVLVSPDLPAGASVLLLGRAHPDSPFRLLHTFVGPFADLQQLTFAPRKPWRGIRYVRLSIPMAPSVGWVSWHELAVYASRR